MNDPGPTATMRPIALLSFTLFALLAHAQTTVQFGSFRFSDGVHPTFSFVFEGTDIRYVESFWRDELKRISAGVVNKKEVIASGVTLPRVSQDTVRIFVKAEQRKGSPMLTAHVAILTTRGWLAPGGDEHAVEAGRAFVQEHSIALRRQLAQQELTDAEKGLALLKNELDASRRELERAEASRTKSLQRADEAAQEQITTRKEMDELAPRVKAQRDVVAKTPDDENTKRLKALLKDEARATEANRKAVDLERDMRKKAEELVWTIRQNKEEQEKKRVAIARQTTLVAALQEKLKNIR